MKEPNNSNLLSIVLQCIDVGITVQNTQGKIVYANDAAAFMIGFKSVKELMNTPTEKVLDNFAIFDKNDKPFDIKKLPGRIAFLKKKPANTLVQFQALNSTERRWSHVKAVPVLDKKMEIEYIVNTFHDVTKSKKEDESVNHFIATASHELKTPLASIKALNQLVEKKFKSGRLGNLEPFFTKIDDKVNEVTKIVNDFLDSTKIRTGTLDFNPEMFDFDEFIDTTISDLQNLFDDHKIIKKGETKKVIVADPSRLRQVLINLLRNAKKYSPDAKEIVVTLSSAKGKVKVSVQDFGIGIAKKESKHIFEPYYRGGKKYTGRVGGLGLGLYIASHIINMHGGDMRVESKIGKGSIFSFNLPNIPKKPRSKNYF